MTKRGAFTRFPEEKKEHIRSVAKAWRDANRGKVLASRKVWLDKLAAMKAAGGPEWEAYKARANAGHKRRYWKNREAESIRNKARWQRDKVRKCAERAARKLANPELYKAREERLWRTKRSYIFYNSCKARCKADGLAFDLTKEWIESRLRAGVCEMSGLPFDLDKKRTPASPSIDRIDANGGYTQANCRMIIWFLNRALSDLGDDYACMVFERVLARRKPKLHLAWVA